MSWNNGYERRKFEQAQKAQAKEYRKCGMNEEQIQAMYLQDLQEYRNNRIVLQSSRKKSKACSLRRSRQATRTIPSSSWNCESV